MAVGSVTQATLPPVDTRTQNNPAQLARTTADQALGPIRTATADAPPVRDADHPPDPTNRAEIRQQQSDFRQAMRERGVEASNPPTQAQLREYFGTFNNDQERGQALRQFEDYTTAFHVHTVDREGHRDDNVRYSPERSYYSNGEYFDSQREARRFARQEGNENFVGTIRTADASSWRDVSRRPDYNGRRVQDCEGFAFMSQELLGAAGYQVTHAANQGERGNAHAQTVVTDPSTGAVAVTSNNKTFTGGTQEELLRQGWEWAGGRGESPGTFYTGPTQARAQAALVVATEGW